jgi:hypothetical protein
MRRFLQAADDFVRDERVPTVREQLPMILLCGAVYGAVMGSYRGLDADGGKQILLSATKVPVLFLVTFMLCLPSYFVLNVLAGLRDDLPQVLRALLAFQSLAAIVLAALAPITALLNVSTTNYGFVVVWSGIMFAIASLLGHSRLRRLYRPLIAANPRHRVLLRGWTILYWFVAIQMAWVLRPFVGDPAKPFQLLRPKAWGNAYLEVINLLTRVLGL